MTEEFALGCKHAFRFGPDEVILCGLKEHTKYTSRVTGRTEYFRQNPHFTGRPGMAMEPTDYPAGRCEEGRDGMACKEFEKKEFKKEEK